ncbi:MAG TPA: hypothetical protein VFG20_22950 [Planctomycetaceae bacterium]|nr:hypothetical protein [Planctomycetaceae bacterium]
MKDDDARAARDAGTMTALLCLGVVAFLFVLLAAMVLPQILGVVIVGGLFVGVFALHYLVWGRWLKITVETDDASTVESPQRESTGSR